MSIGTEVEITSGIRPIALILISIYPECDSELSPREYLDSSHDKIYLSVARVSSGE